jgi:hypothetical protein
MQMSPRDVAAYCKLLQKWGEWEGISLTRIIFDSHGNMWQTCPPSAPGAEAFGPKGSARRVRCEEDIERYRAEEPPGAMRGEEYYYMAVCLLSEDP